MNNLIFAFDADHWGLRLAPYTSEVARQYDDNSRRLVVTGELPEGWAWSMLVRAGGCAQYLNIISLGPVDGGVGVTLTADMVPISGYYTMQLRGTNGGQTRHTNAVVVTIPASLSGDAQWPEVPSEFSQIEANIIALNQHPPIPGDEGYWLTWDLSTGAYITSDLPLPDVSVGPPGPPGEAATVTVGSTTTGEPGTQAQVTNSGTESAAVLNFVVPRGATGATPQIQVRVTQLPEGAEPTVEVTGTAEAPVITLGIPAGATGGQGPQGPAGQTPTITIGQVETLPPGSPVTASITGRTPNLVLNLGIPQGAQGTPGAPGEPGQAATISITETETVAAGTPAAMVELPESTPQARAYKAQIPQGPAGLGVPTPTAEDAGKVPVVNEAGDGYELLPPSGGGELELIKTVTLEESVDTVNIDFSDTPLRFCRVICFLAEEAAGWKRVHINGNGYSIPGINTNVSAQSFLMWEFDLNDTAMIYIFSGVTNVGNGLSGLQGRGAFPLSSSIFGGLDTVQSFTAESPASLGAAGTKYEIWGIKA